jgi:amino acid transporter
MVLLVLLSIFDFRLGTRTQLIIAAVTVAVVVVFDLILTGKGGAHGHTLAPFTFSHTLAGGFQGVFYGIIFAVTSYIGFETSAVLGEETRNPRRAIPASILIAVAFAILFYVWTTYCIAIGVGVNNGSKWATDGTILADLGSTFGGHVMFVLISIAAILSAFIVCLACANAAARTMFAMGREHALPTWFGMTNPRFKTPVNAILAIAVLASIMAAIVGFWFSYGQGPFTVYGLYASIGSIPIIIVYIAMCAGSVIWFRRVEQRYNPITHGLIPIVGLVIFALAVYASVWSGSVPPMPYRIVPYVVLVWLLLGIGVLLYLRSSHPDRVNQIGSILGEEGGDEGAVVDTAAAVHA